MLCFLRIASGEHEPTAWELGVRGLPDPRVGVWQGAALFALHSIGLRVGCLLLFRVRPQRTSPQGLVAAGAIAMLLANMLCLLLPQALPRYAAFGAQGELTADGKLQPCAFGAAVSSSTAEAAPQGGGVSRAGARQCRIAYSVRMAHEM